MSFSTRARCDCCGKWAFYSNLYHFGDYPSVPDGENIGACNKCWEKKDRAKLIEWAIATQEKRR